MREHADKRAAKPARKVTLRGKVLNVADPDPIAIARALRKNKPGGLKAKRAAMEAKFAGR